MSQRSVSGGVQGLRAMFEGSTDTSPPSRGRSPAGSIASDSSRPISKVRTSFISVEKSGQQVPSFGGRKMSTGEGSVAGDNANEGTPLPKIADDGAPEMNGSTLPTESRNGTDVQEYGALGGDGAQDSVSKSNAQEETPSMDVPPANPDKTTTGVEEAPADLLPGDPKIESTFSEGAATKRTEEELGSVLKGSPFQASSGQSLGQDRGNTATIFGGPNSDSGAKAEEPSKLTVQPTTPGSASKDEATKSSSKIITPQPSALDTRKKPSSTTKASASKPADKAAKSPQTPKTGNGTSAAAKPVSKTSSPRQITQPKPRSDIPDKIFGKTYHPLAMQASTSTKPSTATAPKARQTSATTNGAPSRKVTPSTKPRPRSPTRPVRLPAAATAATQSSSAKHDELPSRSPSRASLAGSTKPPIRSSNTTRPTGSATTGLPSRAKSTRSSLLPQSGANQKPKPRTSTASAKADGGSFLARMMRPTESSAQKTHDKAEVKSPPRKSGPPNRRSDVHSDSKGTHQPKASNEDSNSAEETKKAITGTQAQEHDFGEEDGVSKPGNETEKVDEELTSPNGTGAEPVEPAN